MQKNLKNIRNALIIVATFVVPIALIVYFARDLRNIERLIPSTGIAGPIISILIMGILSATPIPTDPIVILNGAIFGPVTGILVSWMGNNLAAVIEYFLGMAIGHVTDFENKKQNLPFGLSRFPANSPWFLFFGRFIPQFGGKLVSITGGVYRVNFFTYLWTAMLSNLFGSVILALGGFTLLHSLP